MGAPGQVFLPSFADCRGFPSALLCEPLRPGVREHHSRVQAWSAGRARGKGTYMLPLGPPEAEFAGRHHVLDTDLSALATASVLRGADGRWVGWALEALTRKQRSTAACRRSIDAGRAGPADPAHHGHLRDDLRRRRERTQCGLLRCPDRDGEGSPPRRQWLPDRRRVVDRDGRGTGFGPLVTVLVHSVAPKVGAAYMKAALTGMGEDELEGARAIGVADSLDLGVGRGQVRGGGPAPGRCRGWPGQLSVRIDSWPPTLAAALRRSS